MDGEASCRGERREDSLANRSRPPSTDGPSPSRHRFGHPYRGAIPGKARGAIRGPELRENCLQGRSRDHDLSKSICRKRRGRDFSGRAAREERRQLARDEMARRGGWSGALPELVPDGRRALLVGDVHDDADPGEDLALLGAAGRLAAAPSVGATLSSGEIVPGGPRTRPTRKNEHDLLVRCFRGWGGAQRAKRDLG